MTEQTPSEAQARAELLRDAQRAIAPALHKFCSGMGPILTAYDGAVVVFGIAVAMMAAQEGPHITAATLRSLADVLAAPTGQPLN